MMMSKPFHFAEIENAVAVLTRAPATAVGAA